MGKGEKQPVITIRTHCSPEQICGPNCVCLSSLTGSPAARHCNDAFILAPNGFNDDGHSRGDHDCKKKINWSYAEMTKPNAHFQARIGLLKFPNHPNSFFV